LRHGAVVGQRGLERLPFLLQHGLPHG
jgi:hypothetical protein